MLDSSLDTVRRLVGYTERRWMGYSQMVGETLLDGGLGYSQMVNGMLSDGG